VRRCHRRVGTVGGGSLVGCSSGCLDRGRLARLGGLGGGLARLRRRLIGGFTHCCAPSWAARCWESVEHSLPIWPPHRTLKTVLFLSASCPRFGALRSYLPRAFRAAAVRRRVRTVPHQS